ncbi:MAG: hypothetical protein JXN65_10310 [Clostridia bacterium]|nr:hypothetical protein [Clostridia bacterium]
MSMIKDMKTYLVARGVSLPIYLGSIPADETECAGLYRYAGKAPHKEAGIECIGLQVRTRAQSYEDALAAINLISSMLGSIGDEETGGDAVNIDGTKYARVYPMQSAYSLGSDEAGVWEIVQNFEVNVIE